MAGNAIYTSASLQCPHGGKVTIVSSNTRAKADGQTLALASDTFTIAGCGFTQPGPKPSPCVRVQWTVPDTRVKVGGMPTLSKSSIGLCISAESVPQGPVTIVSTQTKASTQ
jgi:hypothetical protein